MKLESIAVVAFATCLFLTFYFSFLSFQMVDEASKKENFAFAITSLIASVTILIGLIIYVMIKKLFSKALNH